ncbi:MAG: response regulator transcription factor [Chitinophagaceae bacterium]
MRQKPVTKQRDMNIRVVMIEDDITIREGIAYLVSNANGFSVVSQYSSYHEAEPQLVNDAPDVILLDIQLPGISGIDAITAIKKKLPDVHVLILTVYEKEQTIFTALSNGASGYLTKNVSATKIIESIREVMEGGGPMSAGIAKLVINSFRKNTDSPLSKRETQVLEAIAQGKSRGKIAKELFIDLETVKTHIKNIYYKLNVNSKEEALKVARDEKFI